MSRPWFDKTTGGLLIDDYVNEMPSFRKVMADNVVTSEEFAAQALKVNGLLQQLETMLPPEVKTVATSALCELAVLHAFSLVQAQSQESGK